MLSCMSIFLRLVLLVGVRETIGQEPDVATLIDMYDACNKKFQTVYYELETSVQHGTQKYVFSFRHCSSDGKRQWIGGLKCHEQDGTVNQKVSRMKVDIFGDDWGVHLMQYNPELTSAARPPTALMLRNSREEYIQDLSNRTAYGAPLTGKVPGSDGHSVCDVLRGATHVTIRDEVTQILGYDSHLIEADTKYGLVRAWISPGAGHNCLKWEVIKNQSQFYREGRLTDDHFTGWVARFAAEQVDLVDGKHVVTQASFNQEVTKGKVVLSSETSHYHLTHIDWDPDYEALHAFEIQLPQGTVVIDEDIAGIKYQWTGSELRPLIDDSVIEAIDLSVSDVLAGERTVPGEQVGESGEYGVVRSVGEVDREHSFPQGTIAGRAEEKGVSESGVKAWRLAGGLIVASVILGTTFYVYRYRRKVRGSEQ